MNLFVALAPVAYVFHQRALILKALALLNIPEILALLGILRPLSLSLSLSLSPPPKLQFSRCYEGTHEFYLPNVLKKLLPNVCQIDPQACNFIMELVSGPSHNLNNSRIPYYLNYEPNPTSVYNMIHW